MSNPAARRQMASIGWWTDRLSSAIPWQGDVGQFETACG